MFYINNRESNTMMSALQWHIRKGECKSIKIATAFLTYGGIQLIIDDIKKAIEEYGVSFEIITSDYLAFTDPNVLKYLNGIKGVDIRLFECRDVGYHKKIYIFSSEEKFAIIGSSNLTTSGIVKNEEANLTTTDSEVINLTVEDFYNDWSISSIINDEIINNYQDKYAKIRTQIRKKFLESENNIALEIFPNKMQEVALSNLANHRMKGNINALISAATGTGKTYLSAFDVKATGYKKVLFVCHRKEILESAYKTFQKVFKNSLNFGLLDDAKEYLNYDVLFVTNNFQYKSLDIPADYFEYIIIDEAHRSMAKTYAELIKYFEPKFLLGMTATPFRSDEKDILQLFGENVYNIDLHDAISNNFIVPYRYYSVGLPEYFEDNISKDLDKSYANQLLLDENISIVYESILKYAHGRSGKRKILGFASTIEAAAKLAMDLSNRGISSGYVASKKLDEEKYSKYYLSRDNAIERLESDEDELELIFTVDMYNEGVDIPSIQTILMLRPTDSRIIFTQQIGRGLRKINNVDPNADYAEKKFCTIIDFVANNVKYENFRKLMTLSDSGIVTNSAVKKKLDELNGHYSKETGIFTKFDEVSLNIINKSIVSYSDCDKRFLYTEYNFLERIKGSYLLPSDFIKYDAVDLFKQLDKINHFSNGNKCPYWRNYTYLSFLANSKNKAFNDERAKIINFIQLFLPVFNVNYIRYILDIIERGEYMPNMYDEYFNQIIDTYDFVEYDKDGNVDNKNDNDTRNMDKKCGETLFPGKSFFKILNDNNEFKSLIIDYLGTIVFAYRNINTSFVENHLYTRSTIAKTFKIRGNMSSQGVFTTPVKAIKMAYLSLKKEDQKVSHHTNYTNRIIDRSTIEYYAPSNIFKNESKLKSIIDNHEFIFFITDEVNTYRRYVSKVSNVELSFDDDGRGYFVLHLDTPIEEIFYDRVRKKYSHYFVN